MVAHAYESNSRITQLHYDKRDYVTFDELLNIQRQFMKNYTYEYD